MLYAFCLVLFMCANVIGYNRLDVDITFIIKIEMDCHTYNVEAIAETL